MSLFARCFNHRMLLAALLPLAASCSLTATDVEPDLPTGQVSNGNTLAYRANGLPVVAHNNSSLGAILGSFFGDARPVKGTLDGSNTLTIIGIDSQNEVVDGQKRHEVYFELSAFQGVGTYTLAPASPGSFSGSYYRETPQSTSPQTLFSSLTFYPVPTATPQVTITQWSAGNRHLEGTFSFTGAVPSTTQTISLTDGHFDLTLD